jgi:hypothetical protein
MAKLETVEVRATQLLIFSYTPDTRKYCCCNAESTELNTVACCWYVCKTHTRRVKETESNESLNETIMMMTW